ncbi:hypothetical protein ACSSS7_007898 [Eimeria intestinalis]
MLFDFTCEQLRWSVGWAHHGKRAAKYFPVKLFGMRDGYGMAVRFKSTKTAHNNITTFTGSDTSKGVTEQLENREEVLEPGPTVIAQQPSSSPFGSLSVADKTAVRHAASEARSISSARTSEIDRCAFGRRVDALEQRGRNVAAAAREASAVGTTIQDPSYHTADRGGATRTGEPPASPSSRSISTGRKTPPIKSACEGPPEPQSSLNDSQERQAAHAPPSRTADRRRKFLEPTRGVRLKSPLTYTGLRAVPLF